MRSRKVRSHSIISQFSQKCESFLFLNFSVTDSMVKLLFCGDIDGNWPSLIARLNELQQSQHGPFDAVFITGKNLQTKGVNESVLSLPVKGYAFDKSFNDLNIGNLDIMSEQEVGIVNVVHNLTVG